MLRRNAELTDNIEPVASAVSSKDGTAPLSMGGSGSAISTLLEVAGAQTVQVPVTSIDTFVAQHPEIDVGLIKIDIEGHDIEALLGMERTVARFQPLILAECDDPQLPEIVQRWGYRILAYVRDRNTLAVTFKEMSAANLGKDWTKMVFLVPPHIHLP